MPTVTRGDVAFFRFLGCLYTAILAGFGMLLIGGFAAILIRLFHIPPSIVLSLEELGFAGIVLGPIALVAAGLLWMFRVWWGPLVFLPGLVAGFAYPVLSALGDASPGQRVFYVVLAALYLAAVALVIGAARRYRRGQASTGGPSA